MVEKGESIFFRKLFRCFISFLIFTSVMLASGCKNAEDHKKEIERKGAAYSEEAFLHEVKAGNREKVETLIKAGINVNAKEKDGSTALMIAAEKGDLEIAKLLVGNGADVNARDTGGYTALMFVSYTGNFEIAKLLIKNGADVNARDKDGWTALMFASLEKKTEVADLLKKHGAGK